MKAESIVFALAGMMFGIIVGWVIGSQQTGRQVPAPVQQEAAAAPTTGATTQQPAVLDEARVQALTTIVNSDPKNVQAHVQLGDAYFDAERYADAIKWYDASLKLDPKNVNASTDLGVSYYYLNQPDRALQQFDYSLQIDPKHAKTLLNQGVVRAFGKQDLAGAAESWKKVIQLAPDSREAQAAKSFLDRMQSAHPGGATNPSGSG